MEKKNIIILVIIIVVYLFISFLINYMVNFSKIYIIFPDNINIKYEKGWKIFRDEKTLENKYIITNNGDIISEEKLSINDNIITAKNIQLQDDMVAYKGNNIKNIIYKTSEFNENDYNYLRSILKKKNVNIDLKYTINSKYEIDLNNDGNQETIYSISNNYDTALGKLFSLLMIRNNDEIIQYEEFESEYDSYIPYIYFVDIKKDNNADMIIKNTYSSLTGQQIRMLSFKDDLSYEVVFEEEIK